MSAKALFDAAPDAPTSSAKSLFDAAPESPGIGETAVDHLVHGASGHFSDELYGAGKAIGGTIADKLGLEPHPESFRQLYETYRDEKRAKLALEHAAHPYVATGADIAGSIVPALVPGVAGVKTAATLGGALKTGAALGAVQGLGDSTADSAGGMALDTLKGGAIGAAGGIVGHGVGKLAQGSAELLKDIARNRTISAVGPTAGQVKTLMQKEQVAELADWLHQHKLVAAGDTTEDVAAKLAAHIDDSNTRLGRILNAADSTGAKVHPGDLGGALDDAAVRASMEGPGSSSVTKQLRQAAQDIYDRPESALRPSEAVNWKRGYQEGLNWGNVTNTAQRADKEIAGHAKDFAQYAVDQAHPDLGKAYASANKDLHLGLTADTMAEGGVARATARNILAPSDKAAIALAQMGGKTGPEGMARGVLYAVGNKILRGRAASTLSAASYAGSDALRSLAANAPEQLGRYGPILSQALKSSPQEYAAKTFVLSQTDPEFQAMQKKLTEQ